MLPMSAPMQYGKVIRKQTVFDGEVTTEVEVYTQSLRVKNHQDILVEFLKLHERAKKENLRDIGIQAHDNTDGKPNRIEITWSK